MYRTLLCILVLSTFSIPVFAAGPTIFNSEVHVESTPIPDLERAFAALLERVDGPAWISYTVPMVTGARNLCCGQHSRCSLERSGNLVVHRDDEGDASGELHVLLRIHGQRLTEIRAFSSRCRLDASGLPVYIWEGVGLQQSLDFLVERARNKTSDIAEGALVAIAYHGDAEVDRILERIARGDLAPRLEEEAVFWLGEARGTGGFEALERLRHELQDTEILEHVAFALHLSQAPGALPALIAMARESRSSDVRGTALFWLSQQAGEQAATAIAEASEEDPDLEVKEKAIFALSQLPPDRGVPLLIRYAQTHESREIRKKAMFWLGQTEDPRALDFIEEILTR